MDTQQIKQNWQNRGFSFGIWQDPPGQVWEDYVHDTDELFMLVEGEVTLTIDGKKIEAAIGEEIFIPAHSLHTVSTSHKAGSQWYYGYRNS